MIHFSVASAITPSSNISFLTNANKRALSFSVCLTFSDSWIRLCDKALTRVFIFFNISSSSSFDTSSGVRCANGVVEEGACLVGVVVVLSDGVFLDGVVGAAASSSSDCLFNPLPSRDINPPPLLSLLCILLSLLCCCCS